MKNELSPPTWTIGTLEAATVRARFGAMDPFVLVAPATEPLAQQAASLFDGVSRTLSEAGGWLVETVVGGASPQGFARLMERRANGELAWDRICPFTPDEGPVPMARPVLFDKKPYSMMARARYPCWAVNRHVFSIDLFNADNELMFPYEEKERRLWAVLPYPPQLSMASSEWNSMLKAAAVAVHAEYGFGGTWVGSAAMAYVWPGEFKPLDASTRLSEMTYPHVIVRSRDLPSDGMARLRKEVRHGSRKWSVPICEEFSEGEYVFISTTQDYSNENFHLARAVATVLGKPYVGDRLVKASSRSGE